MATVVVVDDETDLRLLLGIALRRHGFDVVAEAVDGEDGLATVESLRPPVPDVVVLDNRMPGMSGVELAAVLRDRRPEVMVVLFSAFLDRETEAAAAEAGVTMCVGKDRLTDLPEILAGLLAEHAA